jgi:hypothetical protein
MELTYNTERESVRLPEYGRVIQEMLEHARGIEDDFKRQKTVEAIVSLMNLLHPNTRGLDNYKERLWNHVFAIAGHGLKVQPPSGINIREESYTPVRDAVPYPDANIRFRHYGKGVQRMIEKATDMEEGPKKDAFVEVIASYMKLAYKTWSREHYVSDDIIKDDLLALSDGKLALHEGHSSLDALAFSASKREKELQRLQQQRRQQRNAFKNKKKSGSFRPPAGNGGTFKKKK